MKKPRRPEKAGEAKLGGPRSYAPLQHSASVLAAQQAFEPLGDHRSHFIATVFGRRENQHSRSNRTPRRSG